MMEDDFDICEPRINDNEREYENSLRPLTFDSFSGQDKVVENLKVFVMAARMPPDKPVSETFFRIFSCA